MTEQALIVAAHGSHRNPDSATPTLEHADAIRERGCFDQVRAAFWKESPSFRSVVRTVDSETAYVVPLFVSEGYFVDRVLPREFGLGIEDVAGEPIEPELVYTEPVGTHPAMTDVIASRARRLLGDVAEETAALAVVGHGTERNPNSAEAVYDHVAALESRTDFAEVGALFMDEAPYVSEALDRFAAAEIAVVPLFVADGFHTRDEIPELLGITDDPQSGYPVPGEVDGRRIWYASAVGTDPLVPEVILERVAEAGADVDRDADRETAVRPDAAEAFLSWLDRARCEGDSRGREWGDLLVTGDGDAYELRHCADRDADRETLIERDPDTFRRFVRSDDEGRFRPFAGERSLPTGWVLPDLDSRELLGALAAVYPAAIEIWADDPEPVPFQEVAARQTGIYAGVADLSGAELRDLTTAVCGNCAKRREWDERADGDRLPDRSETGDPAGDGGTELPCREPCSFLVAAAREILEADHAGAQLSDHRDADVPPGDLPDPDNRYRVRYRRARGTLSTPD
ncbi:CbiX/SirB N-terminal domain-containing protein [Halapricum hydrolyticum]|uniref:DR2241 family protein n=1 Tax=Halapricum hydrolyticum TaxID=2979991 RepID=A0AAE3IAE1_9EURY|nr:CbiX/SirB N-terminal domain-containing protein [Halapricum hydrolyticum]MCU4717746.1 DR2241 family protein [Halapricum hydrolyticum]MCU4726910.1 DR2241 family protein [Halapricum hydrolyticum]